MSRCISRRRLSIRLKVTIATDGRGSPFPAAAICARYTARTVLPEPGGPITKRERSEGCSSMSRCSLTLMSSSQVGSCISVLSESKSVLIRPMKQGVSQVSGSANRPSFDFNHAVIVRDQLEPGIAKRREELRKVPVGTPSGRIGVEERHRAAPEPRKQAFQLTYEISSIQRRTREEVRHDDEHWTPARYGGPPSRGDVRRPVPVNPWRLINNGRGRRQPLTKFTHRP